MTEKNTFHTSLHIHLWRSTVKVLISESVRVSGFSPHVTFAVS